MLGRILDFFRERQYSRGLGGVADLPRDEVRDFLDNGYPLLVRSSNVGMAQYHPEEEVLMVEFHSSNTAYLYYDVSRREAEDFARARSKGGWVALVLKGPHPIDHPLKPYTQIR